MKTTVLHEPAIQSATTSPPRPTPWRRLTILTAVLVLCFAKTLFALVGFALQNDLYSYILLIPCVSVYFAWHVRKVVATASQPNWTLALLLLGTGALLLLGYLFTLRSGLKLAPADSLAWTSFSFVLLLFGVCSACLGPQSLRALAFPLAFLIFITPLPEAVESGLVSFLQHRSADAAEWLFGLVGTPVLRNDVIFQLPGFSFEVAPECSGIRSTLVLFVASLVAGKLFLHSPYKRAALAIVVIPLGILRNAVRIVTIGELCVYVSPRMIDSNLHHRGGPLFFLVTLVPFFGLLYTLWRLERKSRSAQTGMES